jgi:NhaA family Na+:H+ antiporter
MRQSYKPTVATRRLRVRVKPLADFLRSEAHSGIILMGMAIAALFWANLAPRSYIEFWNSYITLGFGDYTSKMSLLHWVNDGLMALFFLMVGLEIKRELLIGELSSFRKAALPVFAAVGGMVAPALIYAAFNFGKPTQAGWGIPMATDIAFALGAMALLGSRVPYSLKVFLAAVAIVDDLGAVLVIAIFYSSGIDWGAMQIAAACLIVLGIMNWLSVRHPLPYMFVGLFLWIAVLQSGVHATIAGVLLAMMIPTKIYMNPQEFQDTAADAIERFKRNSAGSGRQLMTEERQVAIHELEVACERIQMPLERIEDNLGPWVRYVIMPVFALANAGVLLSGDVRADLSTPVSLGIVLGLVLGKPIGITFFAWLSTKIGMAQLPRGLNWSHIVGMGLLAGIGFTMSLFIGDLAFSDAEIERKMKLSILVASVLAGVVGYSFLRVASKRRVKFTAPRKAA